MTYTLSRRLIAVLLILLTGLTGAASAQELSADEIVDRLETRAETARDVDFVATGAIYNPDGEVIDLNVEVQLIPDLELARLYFVEPAELADNFIIVDGNVVYNYLFLTNQVTILNADDPDALGGLFPQVDAEQAEEEFGLELSLDRLFLGWNITKEGYSESPLGNVYELRLNNEDPSEEISTINAEVLDGSWLPYRLEFVQPDGTVLAELTFVDVMVNEGLEPANLRFFPTNAEVIDER
ncbi:MAG: outer membrane lipoprotein carrier protein LolA [Trueperaceae bacterium]|nr:outer membrane lipoprotein carrier protein LolA [Trueperaceae bacterium]